MGWTASQIAKQLLGLDCANLSNHKISNTHQQNDVKRHLKAKIVIGVTVFVKNNSILALLMIAAQ